MSTRDVLLPAISALAFLTAQPLAAESPISAEPPRPMRSPPGTLDAMPDGRFLPAGSGTPSRAAGWWMIDGDVGR